MSDTTSDYQLSLASGPIWGLRACDPRGKRVLAALARTACLSPIAGQPDHFLVLRDPLLGQPTDCPIGSTIYNLADGDGTDAINVARACSVLAAHTPGALLMHGALVARNAQGVLLGGPGGRGKSTTASRLPMPWQVLSDDAALVLPDRRGRYVAHPWPSWSRLILHDSRETWNVQRSVPLEQIFFLARAEKDAVDVVGGARALCLVLESIEQLRGYLPAELVCADQRLKDLERASRLVSHVPVGLLHISPAGPFWHALDETLTSRQQQR